MAKTTFSKLGLKLENKVESFEFNGQLIEVKQYLPLEDKINVITSIIEKSYDDKSYANWIKVEVISDLEIIYAYTNISFTDKQKEDLYKTYDLLKNSGMLQCIREKIPEAELDFIEDNVHNMVSEIYAQKNSVMGVLEAVAADYSNLSLDAETIQQKLQNKEGMEFLSEVMNKLG